MTTLSVPSPVLRIIVQTPWYCSFTLLYRHITIIFTMLGLLIAAKGDGEELPPKPILAFDAILSNLSEKSGEELHEFLRLFERSNMDEFTDEQIALIEKNLSTIQETDAYVTWGMDKGPPRTMFPNRLASEDCIFRLEYQKIVNEIRKLPMKQRVERIVEGILDPPKLKYWSAHLLANELVIAGSGAVEHATEYKHPELTQFIVPALAEIGDPRAVDYIIEALHTPGKAASVVRPKAATALARFGGDKALAALVEAMKDDTTIEIDKNQWQVWTPSHKPRLGLYYVVRHAASESLTEITGKDWGWLLNEDYKTWKAWLDGGDKRVTFDPRSVTRDDYDRTQLARFLYHRYMSGRPNAWQSRNVLAEEEGIKSLIRDLASLGKEIEPVLKQECRARIRERPEWKAELQDWTQKLILGLRSHPKMSN
ncbi:MAG: HEAT repeat domain-containing protein [Candidatus Hydrogenedentes bacterium]|nr:HEAT repeat domain-containing protein [Candidatus Hydrogenedentota bacterium]